MSMPKDWKPSKWKPEEKQFYVIYKEPNGSHGLTGGYDTPAEAEARATYLQGKDRTTEIIFATWAEAFDKSLGLFTDQWEYIEAMEQSEKEGTLGLNN